MIRPQTCPICEKELAPEAGRMSDSFPFCSERCRNIDLLRWCEGKYAIVQPLRPEDLDEETLQQLEEPTEDQNSEW